MITDGHINDTVKIRRTTDNIRKRPNSGNRHDHSILSGQGSNELSFINPIDLEWMSINYRKERAAKMSPSKRRIILMMF